MGKTELITLVEESRSKDQHIADLEKKLTEQLNKLENSEPGSLADSMVKVNGVMEEAQKTAQQHIDRIRGLETAKQAEAYAIVAQEGGSDIEGREDERRAVENGERKYVIEPAD